MFDDFSEEFARKPRKDFVIPDVKANLEMNKLADKIQSHVSELLRKKDQAVTELMVEIAGLSMDDEYENIVHQRLKSINATSEHQMDIEGAQYIRIVSDLGTLGVVTMRYGEITKEVIQRPWSKEA